MDVFSIGIWRVLVIVIVIASATTETSGFDFINPPNCKRGILGAPFGTLEIDCRTTDSNSTSQLYFNNQPKNSSKGSVYNIDITIQSRGSYRCEAKNQTGNKITWKCYIFPQPNVPFPAFSNAKSEYVTGHSFNLTCSIQQEGNIRLDFYKLVAGNGFIKVPDHRVIRSDSTLTLQFKNPSPMESTVYRCVASRGQQKKEDRTYINIKDPIPIQIVHFPSSKFLVLNSSRKMTIPCSATGWPRPNIRWFKNGKELHKTTKCENGRNVKCLIIISPDNSDKGNYTCLASNEIGSSSKKSIIAVFQFPPQIKDKHKKIVHSQGIKVQNVSCAVVKVQGQIIPTFKWMQNDCYSIKDEDCKATSKWKPIAAGDIQWPPSNVPTLTSTITIPATQFISLYYKCVATNSLGSDSRVIKFHQSRIYRPSVEIKGVDSLNAEETLKVNCIISVGNFTRWLKNGHKIQPSRNPRVSITKRREGKINEAVTLSIVNITVSDAGLYTCKGKAIDGSKMNKTKLIKVKEVFAPKITSLPNITAYHYSQNKTTIELTCHVNANPKPRITWSKPGSSLPLLKEKQNCENIVSGYYLKRGAGNVLLICGADNQHTGLYTCLAYNYKGYDVKSAYVDVLTAPKITTGLPYKILTKSPGGTIAIVCRATGNPLPDVVWTKLGNNGSTIRWKGEGVSSINIKELTKDDYGNYTCTATNSRGTDTMITDIRGALTVPRYQPRPDDKTMMIAMSVGGSLGLMCLLAVLVCCFVNRRQKRLLEEYKAIKYLRKGEDYKLDPKRTILEQCEDLPYDADWEFPFKRLFLQGVIGSGTFGQVLKAEAIGILSFTARDKTSNAFKRRSRLRRRLSSSRIYQDSAGNDFTRTTVAVKTLKAESSESDYKDLATELKVMIHLGEHTNIINLLGACTKTKQLMVIMEFAPHGNLLNFLRSRREIYEATWRKTANNPDAEFTLADLVMYSYQIARGMDFLSSKRCVHRDLAARNILIGDDYVMKIADFGLARDIYKTDVYVKETTGLLPVKWMAPESLFDRIYTHKTDVWSFGVLLWETQTLGGTPYPGVPVEQLMDYLSEGKRMRQPMDCPPEIYAIMRDCWLEKPSERPTFSELVRRIERIIEKKISGQEAEDAYISVFMDEDLHRIYYLEPKEMFKETSPGNSLRDDGPQSMTEEEIQASPLPPVPSPSLENIYKSAQNENDPHYCDPVDNNREPIRYVQTPLSPKRSPKRTNGENIYNFHQNGREPTSAISSLPQGERMDNSRDKRISECSTGVESGIDMDDSYPVSDNSLGRRKHHYGLREPVDAEGMSLLDSSVIKEKTKETFL